MRNLKKFLALVLALMMVVSVMVTVSAADIKPDAEIKASYQEAVDVLAALELVKGDENGVYKPLGEITRAEFAAMLYRTVTGDVNDKDAVLKEMANYSNFSDAPANSWYAGYVNYVYTAGLMKGDGSGNFMPMNNITGYEVLVSLLRAVGYDKKGEFTNNDGWRTNAAVYANRYGVSRGVSELMSAKATRQEVAQLVFNALTNSEVVVFVDATGEYTATQAGTDATLGEINFNGLHRLNDPNKTAKYGALDSTLTKDDPAFNRPNVGDAWVSGTEIIANIAPKAVLTYTDAVTQGKIMADLGLSVKLNGTKNTENAKLAAYLDGTAQSSVVSTGLDRSKVDPKTDNVTITGTGVRTEVYKEVAADGEITITIVSINSYLAQVKNVKAANAATGTKATVDLYPASALATTAISTMTGVEAEGFANNDIVLVTIDKTTPTAPVVESIEKVTPVTATVTVANETSNTITAGGTKYSFNALSTADAGDFDPTKAPTVDLYLDSYGNILGHETVTESVTNIDVAFVTDASVKAVKDGIDGISAEVRVKVVYLDGTTEILPIQVKTATQADVTASSVSATANVEQGSMAVGAKFIMIPKSSSGKNVYYVIDDDTADDVENALDGNTKMGVLYSYTKKDGYISLSGQLTTDDGKTTAAVVENTKKLTVTKNMADVVVTATSPASTTLYATDNTNLVLFKDDKATTYTGYKNFPAGSGGAGVDYTAADTTLAVVYVTTGKNVGSILVVGTSPTIAETPDMYAYYIGTGDTTADGQLHNFWVNGEAKSYLAADDMDGSLTAGQACGLTLNSDGEIGKVTAGVAAHTVTAGTAKIASRVTLVEDDYVVITVADASQNTYKEQTVYVDADSEIYDVKTTGSCATASLTVGDYITYTLDGDNNNHLGAAFIVKVPAAAAPTSVTVADGSGTDTLSASGNADLIQGAVVMTGLSTSAKIKVTVVDASDTSSTMKINGKTTASGTAIADPITKAGPVPVEITVTNTNTGVITVYTYYVTIAAPAA